MKKLFGIAGAVLFCGAAFLSGCSANGAKKPIGTSDEKFHIAAYSTPPNGGTGGAPFGQEPSDNTEENWRIMAEAGFDTAIPIWYDRTHAEVLTTLTNAEKVGVRVLVSDPSLPGLTSIINNSAGLTYNEVALKIKAAEDALIVKYDEFTTFASFGGIKAIDEPSTEKYPAISAAIDWWREHYPDYEFFTNLYPSYATPVQLFGNNYDNSWTFLDYVDQFVNTVNPSQISYDNYPLIRSGMMGVLHTSWLYDLEVFAEASKKYNIPFQLYIQTTQHLNRIAVQYYREAAWQAYSAMAYGVRGLQTFTYWSYMVPESNPNNVGLGIVGSRGEILPCYYAIQELIAEIKAFESLYMNFKWDGTMTVGVSGNGTYASLRNPLSKLDGIEKVDATQDALVGQFKDKSGNRAYMVMNYSSPFKNESNTVTLKFDKAKKVLICKKGRQIVKTIKNNTLKLEFGSGEGFFVIPV